MPYAIRVIQTCRPLLLGAALSLVLGGCSTLTYRQIPFDRPDVAAAATEPAAASAAVEEPPTTEGEAPRGRRVLLLVVEGLRPSVLDAYLRDLREADYEPEWRSGLALLRREGFGMATSARAEAPVPGTGLAAAATLATGTYPAEHRIMGDTFYTARADGRLTRFDAGDPVDGARIHYGPGLSWPSAENPTLPMTLLTRPTWAERMHPDRRVVTVFAPFGGGDWLVPDPPSVGAPAVLPTRYGTAATPLLDREATDGVLEVLLDPTVDVVVGWYRGVSVNSCARPGAECGNAAGGIRGVQSRALRRFDEQLAEILAAYRIGDADGFAQTAVVVTGTGSGADRGPNRPDLSRAIPIESVWSALGERSEGACGERLNAAIDRGDLVIAADGSAVARIYVRGSPPGQAHRHRADLACLGPALERVLEDASWLAGIAHLPAEALGQPGDRADRFAVQLRPSFEEGLPARRRDRLLDRIRLSIDSGPAPRSGEAILFADRGFVFLDPASPRRLDHMARSALDGPSQAIPFVIAHPKLAEVLPSTLRSTPVELADLGPTIMTLVEAPAATGADLPRPPVLAWEGARGALNVVRADRQVRTPRTRALPEVFISEDDAQIVVGMTESAELWPADTVRFRLGDAVYDWDPDANAFPEDVPCSFTEAQKRRTWRCTAPVDRSTPSATLAVVQRSPHGDDEIDGPMTTMIPLALGPSWPQIEAMSAQCATPEALTIKVQAKDALGLARLDLVMVDDRLGEPTRVMGSLAVEVPLGRLEPAVACSKDPFAGACAVAGDAPTIDRAVEVALPIALLDHHARARTLPGTARIDAERLAARWSAAKGPGQAPRAAWLAVDLCNVAGACARQPLLSDVDWRAMAERGCR